MTRRGHTNWYADPNPNPSLCAKVGGAAMGLALVGSLLIVSGPSPAGKSATHFLELGCCPHAAGDGSLALRGLGTACMAETTPLGVTLPASDLDPLRPYHLVLLLPAGSVAQLDVAVSDARGTELLPSVALELGADDAFPWRPPPNKSATSTTASAQEAGGAFAAASRRRRRRLRGIRLGGLGGLGGLSRGGFTRGSGSFRSPNMGSSMGPRPGGSISSAYGTAGGARFAGGMGGARLPAGGYNPGFGYHPMGYNPGMDIATGMMIGSNPNATPNPNPNPQPQP